MGKMDAVAFRPKESEVLIVDWKTSIQKGTESLFAWWDRAGNFGDPLYQTLVYRELLTKHLKRFIEVDIKIGVMLVPYHQSNEELLMPGLCVDFSQMEMEGMLTGLKQYRWVCDKSELVHTINFPGCKVFKKLEELYELQYVDEETHLLKEGTLLKDVISDDAKIADLRKEMGLLSLKVTTNVGEVQDEEDEDEDEHEDEDEEEMGLLPLKVTRNVGEVEKTEGKERRGRGRARGEVRGGPQGGGGGERGRARGEVKGGLQGGGGGRGRARGDVRGGPQGGGGGGGERGRARGEVRGGPQGGGGGERGRARWERRS